MDSCPTPGCACQSGVPKPLRDTCSEGAAQPYCGLDVEASAVADRRSCEPRHSSSGSAARDPRIAARVASSVPPEDSEKHARFRSTLDLHVGLAPPNPTRTRRARFHDRPRGRRIRHVRLRSWMTRVESERDAGTGRARPKSAILLIYRAACVPQGAACERSRQVCFRRLATTASPEADGLTWRCRCAWSWAC